MSAPAPGVLPDSISKDPHAGSWLVFVDLVAEDPTAWLRDTVTPAITTLTAPHPASGAEAESPEEAAGHPVAVCTVGFGSTLFDKAGPTAIRPPGLAAVLPSEVPPDPHDLVFYIFSTADGPVAAFLRSITTTAVEKVHIERGYKRVGTSEVFGQPDGLRNVIPKSARSSLAFIQDDQPLEPHWATGGSYMAYLKIQQDVTQWTQQLDAAAQAQIIGRSADGTRLDLAPGTAPESEPQIAPGAASPPANSHIRKVGPHENTAQDAIQILRRGTPYIEADVDGHLQEGLQFISYQADVADFLTILQRWMLNPNFPATGTGPDALFEPTRKLATFIKGGLYFAVPHDDRFIGAGMFDPAEPHSGVLHIRLTVIDAAGATDPTASLEGANFKITSADGTVSQAVTTNASGHATVSGLPAGVTLTVTQTVAPSGSNLPSPQAQTIKLERCEPGVSSFVNTRTGASGGYGA